MPTLERPLVDRIELAELLNLHKNSVLALVRQEGLPAYRVGRDYRFDLDEVVAWLNERREGAK